MMEKQNKNGFDAGHIFEGPNGESYELMFDIREDIIANWTFLKALGDTPKIMKHDRLPKWLYNILFSWGRMSYER